MDKLNRFITAQDPIYSDALSELRAGKKTSHWMWYVFPQIAGLGKTTIADRYAIQGVDEARAYLKHPILAKRLTECCQSLLIHDKDIYDILGHPDNAKLKSSMTLFSIVAPRAEIFKSVLNKFYNGSLDKLTLDLIRHDIADR